ncbi:MAG: TonB-dependent receptor [Ferruginibacter sp.]
MRSILLLVYFVSICVFVKAQTNGGNSIMGKVVSTTGKAPLEYGTVTIFLKGEKKPLTGTTTDATGNFTLTDIPAGTYVIIFENLGYDANTMNDVLLNKKDAIIDLKTISLTPQKTMLQDVTVTSKVKLIDNKIDKLVFNAEKDVSSQGGVATDLLKKIPQVSVDEDGNVQLSGSSGIKFLINGKPSTAFGSNVADVLQSIPASQIKSIEVITNPGAKYDAQGTGGIINIILKTNNTKGYNGNISLSAGTRMENGSFNFNARKSNFGVNAFFSGNKRLPSNASNDTYRVTIDSNTISTLHQVSNSRFERQGLQTGAGFDWTLKKLNNFSGNISFNSFGMHGSGITNQALQPDKNGGLPETLTLTNSDSRFNIHTTDISLNYKRTFTREYQELEAAVNNSTEHSKGHSNSAQLWLPQDSLYFGIQASNPATTRETEFTIDYTQPLAEEIKLGLGTKAGFYNIASNSDVNSYQPALQTYLPNLFLTNSLNYKQKVYAGYAEISFPVAKLFDAKIGGRYERTEINSYFSNALTQAKVPGYNSFVPSVFISKKFNEKTTVKLSYSKRINRPDYEDLNPFVNTTDPKNLSTGNPNLKPEIGQRIEMAYNRDFDKKGSLMLNLFYRINDHDIQPFIVYYPLYKVGDSLYQDVAVSTRQNIGRENNVGLNLFGDFHFTPKLNIRGNVFVFHRHTINAIDKGYNTNSLNYRFNINASYQFTNSLLAEFFANFNSARHEAQGTYPSFTSYSMSIRKQFWQKKGSIALTASNPFREYLKQKTELKGPNFITNTERKIAFRSIGISFAWKFGKLEFKKDKVENDNNLNAPAQ